MINLTFEEMISRLTKTELQTEREDVFTRDDLTNSEKLERIQLIEIAIRNRSRRGRPSKSIEMKQDKKIAANVTQEEKELVDARARRLGYKRTSDYFRHICLNLTPLLQVNETKIPTSNAEEFVAEQIGSITGLLQHSLMHDKLSKKDAMQIFTLIQEVRQLMVNYQQQRIGQFDEQTALVIANQFLSSKQLMMLARNKDISEELSI